MLDIKYIRDNTDDIKLAAKNKNINVDIDELLSLDKKRREILQKVEDLRAKKNELAKLAKGGRPSDEQIEEGRKIKEETAKAEDDLKEIEEKYFELINRVPNVISDDTPIGKDENENVVVKKVGEPTKFDFNPKDHMELGEALNIIDTATAANVSGARFSYIKGGAALMQFALVQYIFHTLSDEAIISDLAKKVGNPSSKPFVPVVPPVMVKSEIMKKMDRFDPIDDRYYFEKDDMLLVGSAEHSLGPIHMNQTINEKDLPIRYIGYSTSFRREAGSYGKDTKGILRAHQFDKLEMESFTSPENGRVEQDLIVAVQEYIVGKLGIPYQMIAVCSGDMGKPDFRQIDIECWIPSQEKYRETHTSDYMTDFQARRLNTRVKSESGSEFVHMNDATASAIGRMLIAIFENYQNKDGSINVPVVLQKYMPGGIKVIKKDK